MELILAILVWLGILVPAQQITTAHYNEVVTLNSTAIEQIANNTTYTQQAAAAYTEQQKIVIIDPIEH